MYATLLRFAGTWAALVALTVGASARAETVTTKFSFVHPADQNTGKLKATFYATRIDQDHWTIDAVFEPGKDLRHLVQGEYHNVFGTGSASVSVETGVSTQLTASGLYFVVVVSDTFGVQVNIAVKCTCTVDADGVVTVPKDSVWLGF
jgi:hypothetical protein